MNEQVRTLIRERIRTGQLPDSPLDKVYGGNGSNTACACCGGNIGWHDIEYEVRLNTSPYVLLVHLDCHRIWWEESRQSRESRESRVPENRRRSQ